MPHINISNELPGIRGLFALRPDTAKPLTELADVLLQRDDSLTRGERELIATYVSSLNDCFYCQTTHGAVAAVHLDDDEDLVAQVKCDFRRASISEKLKALLGIAGQVQISGKAVTAESVAAARAAGASDLEIHDTVLIAAAFCMYNRYVDGLATLAPTDTKAYNARARRVAQVGYVKANRPIVREPAK
jgi:uncharacterized peroxidase-related enzyme